MKISINYSEKKVYNLKFKSYTKIYEKSNISVHIFKGFNFKKYNSQDAKYFLIYCQEYYSLLNCTRDKNKKCGLLFSRSEGVQVFVTPGTAECQASLSFTISQNFLKLMFIESVMLSNHLILCRPLLLLPSTFPRSRGFSNQSALYLRWPKYSSFSLSISHSNEYSGLISFRIDWFDLLVVQGTLKSLLHHNSKASVLQHSAFFIVQLSHPYMTTGKTIALTRRTFVSKVDSLLFNILSRLVITFLQRSKCLLISWLHSPSAVILVPRKIVCYCFHCFPICYEVMHWRP